MPKRVLHTVATAMAIYIALVGCGINVEHYCSHECAVHHECCHHHHHTCHCGVEIGKACHCGVTHIAAPESNSPHNHSFIPIINCCDAGYCDLVVTNATYAEFNRFTISHAPPILLTGRRVLAKNSLLLI